VFFFSFTKFFFVGIFSDKGWGLVSVGKVAGMDKKKWTAFVLTIIGILAGFGVIPTWIGPVAEVAKEVIDYPVEVVQVVTGVNARCIRVIDGDTIEVSLASDPGGADKIRLIGVDSPETVHPNLPVQYYGPEATTFTKQQCLGQNLILHKQIAGPERGRYGRLLCYVELPSGEILNEKIITTGHGYSYSKYRHEHSAKYDQLQNEAKKSRVGLWNNVTFDDLPGWLRESNPVVLE